MLLNFLVIILLLFVVICGLLFVYQEKLIFFPQKLSKDFQFSFNQHFEEVNIKTGDGILLNNVLFKANNSKGVILYLHGNAGSIDSWGEVAGIYTDLGYDVFMPDYRGYGKSEGRITSEKQLFEDIQASYNYLKTKYRESEIVILGYSIGTGPATKVASANNPKMLILQAPFYSMPDLAKNLYPIIPTFILRYKFRTDKYIRQCRMPVTIFHGTRDEIIYYNSSVKLKALAKSPCSLITLEGVGHNGISNNMQYLIELKKVLIY